MKKMFVAAGVAMAVAAGALLMQKPDCGGHLDCISEAQPLVAQAEFETARQALQCYMDGVWLQAAQSHVPVDPDCARRAAHDVVDLVLG